MSFRKLLLLLLYNWCINLDDCAGRDTEAGFKQSFVSLLVDKKNRLRSGHKSVWFHSQKPDLPPHCIPPGL